jgi:anaerobic sulfite reductase subunit A
MNRKHEIGGRTEEEVYAQYVKHGWEPSKDMFRIMNDHIGLEFEFMAILCEEQILAYNTDNPDRVKRSVKEQKEFLETHLKWVGFFCLDVNRFSQTGFYQGVARVTDAFMTQEKELLGLGGAIWDIE